MNDYLFLVNMTFTAILNKHGMDKAIGKESSRKEWQETFGGEEEDWATIYNSWDELCDLLPEVRDSYRWEFDMVEDEGKDERKQTIRRFNSWDVLVEPMSK